MSTPETPRTWTLQPDGCWWKVTSGDWSDKPHPAETIEVVEKVSVDAERERLLDVIERLEDEVGTDEDGMPWPSAFDAVNLFREYGRLGKEES